MNRNVLLLLFGFLSVQLHAEVKVPAIFGDSMVLQSGKPIPVWGTAAPHQVVTVKFGDTSVTGTASPTGEWRVSLPAQVSSEVGKNMEVSGDSTLVFKDVVVGEVWLCSGQSNMEFNLGRAHNADVAVPKANDPELRFFLVRKVASLTPGKEIVGRWIKCTPLTAPGFSAVGYFFGQELRSSLSEPVGLIGSYWGGTPAQSWTSVEGLEKEPSLKNYVDEFHANQAQVASREKDFPAIRAAYDAEMAQWSKDVYPQFQAEMKKWSEAAYVAQAHNQPLPPKPMPSAPMPKVPLPPDEGGAGPGNLFNGMISPLIPFAIRGVIWYQGEANAGKPAEYLTLFPALIKDWRAHWGESDFPFLFVQLARYNPNPIQSWPYLREAQYKTLSLPNTGMAVASDIGDPANIHPKDKFDVGKRLAAVALNQVYSQKVPDAGPEYSSMAISGNSITVTFKNVGSGLIIGSAPWLPPGLAPLTTDRLQGFYITDKTNSWMEANAHIDGANIIISSPKISEPIAVRYAWENCPNANLYNKEGFPAVSFRTDDIPFAIKTAVAPASP